MHSERQSQESQDIDTHKHILFLPIGSNVTVQEKNVRPRTHGIIIGWWTGDQNGRSYRIRVTKTGCSIARGKRHKHNSTSTEDYLWNDIKRPIRHWQ